MICRMCLLESDEALEIFSSEYSRYNIPSTIAQHFWFEPKHDDRISNQICNDCWWKIESFHTYYLSVEEAHRDLSRLPVVHPGCVDDDIKVKVEVEGSQIAFIDVNQQNIGEQSSTYDNEVGFVKLEIHEEDKEVILNQEPDSKVIEQNNIKHPDAEPEKKKRLTSRAAKSRSKYLEIEENIEELVKVETVDESVINNDTCEESDSDYEPLARMLPKRKRCKTTKKPQEKHCETIKKPQEKSKSDCTKTQQKGKYSSEEYLNKLKEDDLKISKHMKLKCDLCNEEFQSFIEVKAHFREAHNKRGYVVCCNKRLYKRVFLVDHVNRHLNPEYFKCDECNKTFADKQCLQLHMIRHQSDESKMFPCEQCPKRFAKQYMLEQHRWSHIPEEEREHRCQDCGKAFPTHGRLQTHRKYVHENGHMCHICAKVISGKEQFAKHQLEHAGVPVPREECPVCGAMLKTKQVLRKHLRVHTEVDMEHKCKICGKVAPSRGALKSHVQYVHSSDRSYKCSVCNKGFKKAIVLKEHMTTHTGEVLYKCPHCPKTFNSHANMHAHIKRVHKKEWEEGRKNRPGPSENPNSAENATSMENATPSGNAIPSENATSAESGILSENDTLKTATEIYESALNKLAMQHFMNMNMNM